jgi:hypothetical protein
LKYDTPSGLAAHIELSRIFPTLGSPPKKGEREKKRKGKKEPSTTTPSQAKKERESQSGYSKVSSLSLSLSLSLIFNISSSSNTSAKSIESSFCGDFPCLELSFLAHTYTSTLTDISPGQPHPWILTHEAQPPNLARPRKEVQRYDTRPRDFSSRPVSTDNKKESYHSGARVQLDEYVSYVSYRISYPRLTVQPVLAPSYPRGLWTGLCLTLQPPCPCPTVAAAAGPRIANYWAHAWPPLTTLLLFPHSTAISLSLSRPSQVKSSAAPGHHTHASLSLTLTSPPQRTKGLSVQAPKNPPPNSHTLHASHLPPPCARRPLNPQSLPFPIITLRLRCWPYKTPAPLGTSSPPLLPRHRNSILEQPQPHTRHHLPTTTLVTNTTTLPRFTAPVHNFK